MFAATFSSMNQPGERVKGQLSQEPERLRWHRVKAALGLRKAAAQAGISYGYLSELENGKKSASPEMLAALAAAYGCDITELMPPEPWHPRDLRPDAQCADCGEPWSVTHSCAGTPALAG